MNRWQAVGGGGARGGGGGGECSHNKALHGGLLVLGRVAVGAPDMDVDLVPHARLKPHHVKHLQQQQ